MLCEVLAEKLEPGSLFSDRILNWTGNAVADALALRAAGGLHALARSGKCMQLASVYPPETSSPELLWKAIKVAISEHDAFLAGYLDSAPQTNEVARSNTILGGCLHISKMTGLPLDLYEIGSSAGLNLGFEHYDYDLDASHWNGGASVKIQSRWTGNIPDVATPVSVNNRCGCDLNPLDPDSAADRARLLSYVWADQLERKARLEAALSFAASAKYQIERSDAASWVERKLADPAISGHVRVLLHTIVWQYLPAQTKQKIIGALNYAGAGASEKTPLAWLRVEPDDIKGSASIRLTMWPDGKEIILGRADFHGRWTDWT